MRFTSICYQHLSFLVFFFLRHFQNLQVGKKSKNQNIRDFSSVHLTHSIQTCNDRRKVKFLLLYCVLENPSQDSDFLIFLEHFCMETYISKPMMQTGSFAHQKWMGQVSIDLKTVNN